MPVVPEICGEDGSVRAGALTTLVDVIGGGLAASTAHPNWIATADLTLHLTAAATEGVVEARARVLRAGRTTVVLEVDLAVGRRPDRDRDDELRRAPRRAENPDIATTRPAGPSTMALAASGARRTAVRPRRHRHRRRRARRRRASRARVGDELDGRVAGRRGRLGRRSGRGDRVATRLRHATRRHRRPAHVFGVRSRSDRCAPRRTSLRAHPSTASRASSSSTLARSRARCRSHDAVATRSLT